jgi:putative oxidoreductase
MNDDFGKLVVRLSVGVLLLFHGVHKVLNGIDGIKHMVAAHGLPDYLAYGVYLGEVVGPVLVIIGLFSRVGGVLIVINMIVAIALAGSANLLVLDPHTGGYALELEALYLLSGVAAITLGAGRFSLGGANGRLN